MPRTKRRTVKRSSEINMTVGSTMENQPKNIKEILNEFDSEKKNIESYFSDLFDNFRNALENSYLMIHMNSTEHLSKNLYNYIIECEKENSDTAITSTSKGNGRPTRTASKTAATKTRQISASKATTSKTNSSTAVANHLSATADKFKTPVNRPPLSLATVTPKINMNEPISMMRRPNQGEVALSMTGSPLMVSSVSRDDMATVSVPLPNGNMLSILPRAGATMNGMNVSFDEQTKNELLLLKGNIEGLLKLTK